MAEPEGLEYLEWGCMLQRRLQNESDQMAQSSAALEVSTPSRREREDITCQSRWLDSGQIQPASPPSGCCSALYEPLILWCSQYFSFQVGTYNAYLASMVDMLAVKQTLMATVQYRVWQFVINKYICTYEWRFLPTFDRHD
jgi:hypothetical protein